MVRKKIKGRVFFFLFFAMFFLLGGPTLAAEKTGALDAPQATLTEKRFVYNGDVQYITLDELSHPKAESGHFSFAWYKDGELLSCAASAVPIRSVSDSGTYYCKVTFTCDGKSTEKITDAVEIRMEKMEVQLPEIPTMIYTGYRQYPQVYENAHYSVEENVGAVEAGKYFIVFALKDKENLVFPAVPGAEISADGAQLSLPYTVECAENVFSTPLSMPTCYEGRVPMPGAFAKFGEVRYRYYADAAGVREIAPPSAVGTYYVQAVVDGSASVLPLSSALLCFEIQPLTVSALRMLSPPARLSYTAFEIPSLEGLSLVATMADGSTQAVPTEALEVIYPSGASCLLAKDTYVLLSYGGALLPLTLSVTRMPLDFSSVVWSTEGWTYDGEMREITVSGLPPEVGISTYRGNRIRNAGAYTVTAVLAYDFENYDGPQTLEYALTVARCSVPVPSIHPATYNGTPLMPHLSEDSDLYAFENLPHILHAGTHFITLRLTDAQNYRFAGTDSASLNIPFVVRPIPLSVEIEAVKLHIGERFSLPKFKIVSGTLFAGDSLGFGAREGSDGMEYYFENTDYAVTYTGGAIERIYRFTTAVETVAFYGSAVLILIVLCLLAFILLRRKRVRPALSGAPHALGTACTYPVFEKRDHSSLPSAGEEYRLTEQSAPTVGEADADSDASEENPAMEENADVKRENISPDAVDISTANALITDALAEALVMAEDRVIYTDGSRHGVINVDTLSAAFAPGETVDINRLKKKRLIGQDVGYLKVLARGSIDKPLTVYADDFSLGAIKMIALTGGRTFHVSTRPLP